MPFTMPDFPLLSFEQANPRYAAQKYHQDLQKSQLENALQQIKLKYAEPNEMAALQQAQALPLETQARTGLINTQNQWFPKTAQADIHQSLAAALASRASAGLSGANANLIRQQTPFLTEQEKQKSLQEGLKVKYPGLGLSGPAGMVAQALYAKDNGLTFGNENPSQPGAPSQVPTQNQGVPGIGGQSASSNSIVDYLIKAANANVNAKLARTQLDTERAKNYRYAIMPVDQKREFHAQLNGMGLNLSEQQKAIEDNKSISQIAVEHGFDPDNLPPLKFSATTPNVTQMNKRIAASVGMENINEFVIKGIEPYSQTLGGFSKPLMQDFLHGTNQDKIEKYLAAKMLIPESAALKITGLQGQVGIEAMRHVEETSLQNADVPEYVKPFITPKVWRNAQELAKKNILESIAKENKIFEPKNKSKTIDAFSTEELLKMRRQAK